MDGLISKIANRDLYTEYIYTIFIAHAWGWNANTILLFEYHIDDQVSCQSSMKAKIYLKNYHFRSSFNLKNKDHIHLYMLIFVIPAMQMFSIHCLVNQFLGQ